MHRVHDNPLLLSAFYPLLGRAEACARRAAHSEEATDNYQMRRLARTRHRLLRSACSSRAIPATSSQDGRAAAWERTYLAQTQAELDMAYAEWAETYDDESMRLFGYAAPAEAARVLSRHLGPELDARILDAGAGTGLVGSFLAARGYRNLLASTARDRCWSRRGRRATTPSCAARTWAIRAHPNPHPNAHSHPHAHPYPHSHPNPNPHPHPYPNQAIRPRWSRAASPLSSPSAR